jgi:hypothetical protein
MSRKTKKLSPVSDLEVLHLFANKLSHLPPDADVIVAGNVVLEALAPYRLNKSGTIICEAKILKRRLHMIFLMYDSPEGSELISLHKYPNPENLPDIFSAEGYGTSKFDCPATEMLYEESLEGGASGECGDAGTTGWYGLVRGPFHHPQLKPFAGAILEENSQGFVVSEFYETKKDLHDTWKRINDEVSATEEGDGEKDNE